MANFCANCGHELRETDKYCSECGVPVGASAATSPPIQWEQCIIRFQVGGYVGNKCHFFAEATGPYGVRTIDYSGKCDSYTAERGIGNLVAIPNGAKADKELREMVQRLLAGGWEMLQDKGPEFWNIRFRRPFRG